MIRPVESPRDIEIRKPTPDRYSEILSPEALGFLKRLHEEFSSRIDLLRAERVSRQQEWSAGEPLDFLEDTKLVRDSDWEIAPLPKDLLRRTVEITGPVDRKMIINALNSGADVFMADLEDATSPTWANVVEGQIHLFDAVRRKIDFQSGGKRYALVDDPALLMVRPRGLHLDETNVHIAGRPVPASIFDFGLYFFHNAKELLKRGTGPYFYLPKLEHFQEARLWNDIFLFSQQLLDVPRGSVRATVLIETLPAAFQMNEILFELREHAAGLNCGRWDYIFSAIKVRREDPGAVLPDRDQVNMEQPCMRAYSQLLVKTCHRRGALAIGGMAAQIPIKMDPAGNEKAMERVRADKRREVKDGYDGTWVAHPALVPIARRVFEDRGVVENQLYVMRGDVNVTARDLLEVPLGTQTESGLRTNIRIAILYLESWISGRGCVPLFHLMEDAATAEISRAQVWQWIRHRAPLDDGRDVSPELVKVLIAEEFENIQREYRDALFEVGRFEDARDVFESLCLSTEMEDFLTLSAQRLLEGRPRKASVLSKESAGSQQPPLLRQPAESRNAAPQQPVLLQQPADKPQQPALLQQPAQHKKTVLVPTRMSKVQGETETMAPRDQEPKDTKLAVPATRWEGVERPYSGKDVLKLRGSVKVEHTLARLGAQRLWQLLTSEDYINALGAQTGNQAMQQVRAGLKAIYVSGWQVAADANLASQTYPDQSLYPANSVPMLVKRINAALQRADQIDHAEMMAAGGNGNGNGHANGNGHTNGATNGNGHSHEKVAAKNWFAPIVADAEAGFGGPLNAYELMKAMIEAGAAGVHFEDQLSSEKKCGHLGGKVLVPTSQFIRTLVAARLAADVLDVPSLVIARTDAESARLITSDIDPRDHEFLTGERTPEGFFRITGGPDQAIARGIAYAPYCDLIWCETSTPDLAEARRFAEAVRAKFPTKMLAYNCSPSFNWKKNLDDATIAKFQRELGAMGYKFQFVTLAGFHQLNHGMFELARAYKTDGMAAYSKLQQAEFDSEVHGYTATRHQREVGTGYFDQVGQVISGGLSSTLALEESTEAAQF